ncbi:MAG: hypothetical protein EP332_10610 [Bacteroidetes bacterium]|nr:MAG: hypothetical protein EP332_10610 [Bacteroidota bacterium]
MITRENYTVFTEDFIAGKLSPEMEEAYMAFLEANPDLMDIDLEESDAKLDDGFLSQLKKPIQIDEQNLDEAIIAQLEGDLNQEEEERLEAFMLAHPEREEDRKLIALTVLRPSIGEYFPNKNVLYKKGGFRIPPAIWYSAAASVLIAALWIYGTGKNELNPTEPVFSQVETFTQEEVKPKAFEEIKSEVSTTPSKEQEANPLAPKRVNRQSPQRHIPAITPEEAPQIKRLESLPVIMASLNETEPSLTVSQLQVAHYDISFSDLELEAEKQDQTLLQYAYKKLRKTVGQDERVVPENEIPHDAATIVADKVRSYVGFNESQETVSFRIGNFELKRKKR